MPKTPDGARKPQDRLAAEADGIDAAESGEFTSFDFKGNTLRVKPFLDWDKTAMGSINRLDLDGWAQGALHDDDVATFLTTRATVRESVAFIKAVTEKSGAGIDVGELFAS